MFGDHADTAVLSRPEEAPSDNNGPESDRPTYHDVSYGDDRPAPGPANNPLVRGLIVLVLMALASTVLLVVDDEGETGSVDAGADRLDSVAAAAPAALTAARLDPTTTVQALTPEPEVGITDDASTARTPDAWASAIDVDAIRSQTLRDLGTTTTVPPTTQPPTTLPPTTAAPATEAPATTAVPPTEASTSSTPADGAAPPEEADPSPEDPAPDPDADPDPTTTAPPETTVPVTEPPADNGWVDTGNGVLVPPVLLEIRWCESGDRYDAANPSSSARGAYQFLKGSWAAYGHADRYGVTTADQASPAQQDEAALLTWERDGTRPWNASKHCWG